MALSDRLKTQSTEVIGNELFIVGDVKTSFLTLGQFQAIMGPEWVLADGQDVTGSEYATITGLTVVPDCRGRFMRMEGTGSAALRGLQSQGTAPNGLSNAASTVSGSVDINHDHAAATSGNPSANHTHGSSFSLSGGAHNHTYTNFTSGTFDPPASGWSGDQGGTALQQETVPSTSSGHGHTFSGSTGTVSSWHTHSTDLPALGASAVALGSGSAVAQVITSSDTETRPNNVTCNYFIKIN